jgi:hypothetical protein
VLRGIRGSYESGLFVLQSKYYTTCFLRLLHLLRLLR